jgi:phenylacetate-CoA ligase
MPDRTNLTLERLRPAVFPGPRAQAAFRAQLSLADSQWFERERLEKYQLERLKALARFTSRRTDYGRRHVPWESIESASTLSGALAQLPILSREMLRDEGETLRPDRLPRGHVAAADLASSGSTGLVVRLTATNVWLRWQRALGLRSHLWAGSDFHRAIGIIRRQDPGAATWPHGSVNRRWAAPGDVPFPTGPAYLLNAYTPLGQQWEWLKRVRPSYLLALPSILRNFAQRDDAGTIGLLGILTLGEVVDEALRSLVRDRLGLKIHDVYSSEEAGSIAIQCPESSAYHVQSETLVVEILNAAGAQCAPGEIGRVVVTPLHNFATPLLRYELNDYAEAGGSCVCGRGLPALRRIMGRRRNILTTPDGRQYWPALRLIQGIVPIREHQYRQVALDVIEVWLAVDKPVTGEQEQRMREVLTAGLLGSKDTPAPFEFRFRYVSEFPRSGNAKHEEFVSLVDPVVRS